VETGLISTKIIAPSTAYLRIKNTSGATANANDMGYINEAGEYKTTTTASDLKSWCVVVTGGLNNADITIAIAGRRTIN
jgi:hypothetical protein